MKKNNSKNTTVHKINNLLTNIGLSTELLLQELHGPLNPQQKKYLKGILSESKKMKNIIKKI